MKRTIQLFSSIVFFALVGCSNNDVSDKSEPVKSDTTSTRVKSEDKKTILFFGNSLTAGYGVEADESFPALIQMCIDSLDLPYTVVNAGVSGETTATGLSRIDWVLEKKDVDLFIQDLGANDGLRGLPPAETKKNLITMIECVRNVHPKSEIILAGMMVLTCAKKFLLMEICTICDNKTTIWRRLFTILIKEFSLIMIPIHLKPFLNFY
ncbi:arylesterase [Cryomorpha ignava]|uniref:Arylesterase n=1 Tax=Cryomorpha ignava TaxID=101383 RepID=A0A7K3WLM7_9FLAO|nr:GDSL-type esterase/lipase family protein [Cryomorpha ignava]NEN21941.1 arylesterase [Cryomorpha ignava]